MDWQDFLNVLDKIKNLKHKLLFATSAYLRLRISDVAVLRWSQLTDVTHTRIVEIKTGRVRILAIPPALQLHLDAWRKTDKYNDTDAYIFRTDRHNPSLSAPCTSTISNICMKYHNLFHTVGNIPKNVTIGFHTFRKTGSMRLYNILCQEMTSAEALMHVQKDLGHSSLQTTMRYLGIYEGQIDHSIMQM